MARMYHTLVIRDVDPRSTWGIAFGAYDLDDVKAERDEYRDNGWRARSVKIVHTSPRQADIDAAVAALNFKSGTE